MIFQESNQITITFLKEFRTAVGLSTGTLGVEGRPCRLVSFQQLTKTDIKIGQSCKGVETCGPRLQMAFTEPESIEVIIRGLQKAKKDLIKLKGKK